MLRYVNSCDLCNTVWYKSLTGKNFDELIVGHIRNTLTGKGFVQITGLTSNLSKFSLLKLLCNDLTLVYD